MDINNKLNGIENELRFIREEFFNSNSDELLISNDLFDVSLEYEYTQLYDVSRYEFTSLCIKDKTCNKSLVISLSLDDVIDISSHLNKLINKYTLYREEMRENS